MWRVAGAEQHTARYWTRRALSEDPTGAGPSDLCGFRPALLSLDWELTLLALGADDVTPCWGGTIALRSGPRSGPNGVIGSQHSIRRAPLC